MRNSRRCRISIEPLRSALRKLLSPLGLKARIETEGLVITANHSRLVHRGIGTDRWINVNDDLMRSSEEKLSKSVSVTFVETPLDEAIEIISDQLDLPIVLDRRSLEDIGLTTAEPVTAEIAGLSGYDLLSIILDRLDLTLGVKNNVHTVMERNAADHRLLSRIYWLEGIGLAGDFDSLIQLFQTTIEPDTWEALGGPSTMSPAPGERPGIVISTTYDTHRQIEQIIDVLRENSFAQDMVTEEVEVPAPAGAIQNALPGGFDGGMGGMSGMGGGGGFM